MGLRPQEADGASRSGHAASKVSSSAIVLAIPSTQQWRTSCGNLGVLFGTPSSCTPALSMAAWIEVEMVVRGGEKRMARGSNERAGRISEDVGYPSDVRPKVSANSRRGPSHIYKLRPDRAQNPGLACAAAAPFENSVLGACANLEINRANFSSRSELNPPHFYSTLECRVEGLLVDTLRPVELAVTPSKQTKSVHASRHLNEGYPKRCFGAFSTSPQALTPAAKN
jgi:hypothetical protein